jgi:hypothetical protein
MKLDPNVWGPKYWFFLHSVAYAYPAAPTATMKRKYYDLIQNMPLFIPNHEIGDLFAGLLSEYPVSPYLDNRDSFIRWVWFIHNKINKHLGKPDVSLHQSLDTYLGEYIPKPIAVSQNLQLRSAIIHTAIILILIFLIYTASE